MLEPCNQKSIYSNWTRTSDKTTNPRDGGVNLLFWLIFPENYMKMRKIKVEGGRLRGGGVHFSVTPWKRLFPWTIRDITCFLLSQAWLINNIQMDEILYNSFELNKKDFEIGHFQGARLKPGLVSLPSHTRAP